MSQSPDKRLSEAVWACDFEQIRTAVEAGANVNHVDDDAVPLEDLLYAASHAVEEGRVTKEELVSVVEYLISAGADVDYRGDDGCGPLLACVHAALPMLAEVLLQHGADPNYFLEDGRSLYSTATMDYYQVDTHYPGLVWPEPKDADRVTEETWLDFLERGSKVLGVHPPEVAKVLRRYGAKSTNELRDGVRAPTVDQTERPNQTGGSSPLPLEQPTETLSELDLVYRYAEAWNRLDMNIVAPYLAEDVVYASQHVFDELRGRSAVELHLRGKANTMRSGQPESEVCAEIGFCGSQEGWTVQVLSAKENRPCILLQQGFSNEPVVLVLLDVQQGRILRIDICTVAPHPSSAKRTGIYPSTP